MVDLGMLVVVVTPMGEKVFIRLVGEGKKADLLDVMEFPPCVVMSAFMLGDACTLIALGN
jgi:hypothetical protein